MLLYRHFAIMVRKSSILGPGQSDFARDKALEGLAREGVRHLGAWSKPSWSMEEHILELDEHRFYRSAGDLGAKSGLASGLGARSVTYQHF